MPILQMIHRVNVHQMAKLAPNPGCLASLAEFSVFSSALWEKGISNGWTRMYKGPEARMWLVRLRSCWKAIVAGAERARVRTKDGGGEVEGLDSEGCDEELGTHCAPLSCCCWDQHSRGGAGWLAGADRTVWQGRILGPLWGKMSERGAAGGAQGLGGRPSSSGGPAQRIRKRSSLPAASPVLVGYLSRLLHGVKTGLELSPDALFSCPLLASVSSSRKQGP